MSIEGGGDSRDTPKPIPDQMRRQWESTMRICKLDADFFNALHTLSVIDDCFRNNQWEKLQPVQTYREREEKYDQFYIGYADFIVGLSDPDAVAALDKLVQEFNTDLERIKQERDKEAVETFWEKAKELLYKRNRR